MNARTAYALAPVAFVSGYLNAMALAEGPDAARAAAYSIAWDVVTWPLTSTGQAVADVALVCAAVTIAALGAGTVFFRALDAYGPRVARAVGRHAFKVARAAYRVAR
jgi:hypothetical protein